MGGEGGGRRSETGKNREVNEAVKKLKDTTAALHPSSGV